MGFLDRFRKIEPKVENEVEPFPEKGEFKNIKYRIDGDSVMLTLKNGREIEFAPPYFHGNDRNIERYDLLKRGGGEDWEKHFLVVGNYPAAYPRGPHTPYTKNSGYGSEPSDEYFNPMRAWGISTHEYDELAPVANEIMHKYYASRQGK